MNVSLSRKRVFAGIIKLRWGRTGVGWALNAMTGVFMRRPCENTGTQGEPHVMTETRDFSAMSTKQGFLAITRS